MLIAMLNMANMFAVVIFGSGKNIGVTAIVIVVEQEK